MVFIAIDPAQAASVASEMLKNLPQMLETIQALSYIFLVLFFGSITVLGIRTYLTFWKRFAIRIVFGIFSLFCGAALSVFVPLFNEGFFSLLHIDMLVAGTVSSVAFAAALWLITSSFPMDTAIKKRIEKLQERLQKAKSWKPPENMLLNPYMISGIAITAVLLLMSALYFQGFPNLQQEILLKFGLSPDDLAELSDMMAGMNVDLPGGGSITAGCTNVLSKIVKNQNNIASILSQDYENDALKTDMQQRLGEDIISMKMGEVEGVTIIMGIAESRSYCVSNEEEICLCQKI